MQSHMLQDRRDQCMQNKEYKGMTHTFAWFLLEMIKIILVNFLGHTHALVNGNTHMHNSIHKEGIINSSCMGKGKESESSIKYKTLMTFKGKQFVIYTNTYV